MPASVDTVRIKPTDVDAVVIGAGFAGLYAVHKLRQLGLTHRGFERGEVDVPYAVFFLEADFAQSGAGEFGGAEEGRIDRCAGEGFFARLDEGAAGHVERGNEAGEPDDLFRGGGVAMVRLQIIDGGFDRGFWRNGVAEDAVVGAFLQGGDNFRRGKEVHVGDPHGHDVASRVAFPFERTGAAAVGAGGEIVSHEASEHGTPAKQGKTDARQAADGPNLNHRK